MPPTETPFEQFFAEKIKERGVSLKKLAETTGIAPAHIESLLRGDFENVPSAPYLHGYIVRIGEALGFDGEEWWAALKKEGLVKHSGDADTLPHNRFIKQSPPKYLWWIGAGIVVLIYVVFQAPRIFGTPTITLAFPDTDPYVTQSSTITLSGTVTGADSLYLVGAEGVADQIAIGPGGVWQEGVLLGTGPNQFEITAKKFLGGQTSLTEQVFSEPLGASSPSASSSPAAASGTAAGTPSVSGTPVF